MPARIHVHNVDSIWAEFSAGKSMDHFKSEHSLITMNVASCRSFKTLSARFWWFWWPLDIRQNWQRWHWCCCWPYLICTIMHGGRYQHTNHSETFWNTTSSRWVSFFSVSSRCYTFPGRRFTNICVIYRFRHYPSSEDYWWLCR